MREYLDSRLVDALPIGWKQLIKKVKVPSSAGNKSKEIVTSDCYFFIPSAIEVNSAMIDEPYIYEGQTISYMTGNESRIKHNAEGKPTKYWLRTPLQLTMDTSMQSRRLVSCMASTIHPNSWV